MEGFYTMKCFGEGDNNANSNIFSCVYDNNFNYSDFKPITKGKVIGAIDGGSSSKLPPLKQEKGDKGKGVEKEI